MVLTALGLGRVQGAPDLLCDLLQTYSQVLRRAGRFTEAYDCCKEALTLVPQLAVEERPYLRANVEYEIGKIARDQKDWDKADRYFRQAQTVFRSDDATAAFNPERAWGLLGNLGFIAHQRGDLDQAAPLYEQARAFFQQVGGVGYLVTILTRLATLEAERGRKAQALALTQEALAYSRRIGLAQEQTQLEALERGLTSRSENSIPG
jgi:tetratricopeptide (TPR) repeat protein